MKPATLLVVSFAVIALAGCDAKPQPTESSPVAQATASSTSSPTHSSAPSATPSASSTASTRPTSTPTPLPWLRFTSLPHHYKISYPFGWLVTPGDAGVPDQFDNYGYPIVTVFRETVSGTASVNRTVPGEVASYKSRYQAKLVSTTNVRLADGYAGKVLTFNGTDNGAKVVIRDVIVARGHYGYFLVLRGQTAQATADLATFERMYGTWRPTA